MRKLVPRNLILHSNSSSVLGSANQYTSVRMTCFPDSFVAGVYGALMSFDSNNTI